MPPARQSSNDWSSRSIPNKAFKPPSRTNSRQSGTPQMESSRASSSAESSPRATISTSTSANRQSTPSNMTTSEPDYILAEVIDHEPELDDTPIVPEKLLRKLLFSHFSSSDTKISTDATKVIGEYIKVFITEAIARAILERRKTDKKTGGGGRGTFIEVEDLEKLAPQLILDF